MIYLYKEVICTELIQTRLLDLMRANKYSYQDLADITHINKATLQRYFTGRSKKIPIERIWPIAFALNTTPNYLMGDTDDPAPSYVSSPTTRRDQLPDSLTRLQERTLKEPIFANLVECILPLEEPAIKSTIAFISVLTREE